MGAILMAWESSLTLRDRFAVSRELLNTNLPHHKQVGYTYQGFIKAMLGCSDFMMPQLQHHLRQCIKMIAGPHWHRLGWVAFTVDGTKIDCPRTRKNESFFGCAGKAKCAPQQLLTTLLHMGTGLPWAWISGGVNESERDHLRRLIEFLPSAALLVADAGFTGFDLLKQLDSKGVSFLIRIGANVTLLRQLGFGVQEHGNTVYLWPNNRRQRRPLVLRLIVIQSPQGMKPVYLITNVDDEAMLSDETAAVLYRMRWGVEVFYRSLKQTLQRRKMRSDAPRQAVLELHWSIIGLLLLGLMSVSGIIGRGKDPLCWSVACALRRVHQAMRKNVVSLKKFIRKLSEAMKDTYTRKSSKKARDWPHKKSQSPPGIPRLRAAKPSEISRAQHFTTKTATP